MKEQATLDGAMKRFLDEKPATFDEGLAAIALAKVAAAGGHIMAQKHLMYARPCVNARVAVWRVMGGDGATVEVFVEGDPRGLDHQKKLKQIYLMARALEVLDLDGARNEELCRRALWALCGEVAL